MPEQIKQNIANIRAARIVLIHVRSYLTTISGGINTNPSLKVENPIIASDETQAPLSKPRFRGHFYDSAVAIYC
jgi:hypothetical protein